MSLPLVAAVRGKGHSHSRWHPFRDKVWELRGLGPTVGEGHVSGICNEGGVRQLMEIVTGSSRTF